MTENIDIDIGTLPVIEGSQWFRELTQKLDFGRSKDGKVHLDPIPVDPPGVMVHLPGAPKGVNDYLSPGAEIIFYQPYPPTNYTHSIVAILMKDRQIAIRGDGHIVRRNHR